MYSGPIPQHPVETTDQTFERLGLDPEILDLLAEIGFEHPTPIQAGVIPLALEDRDVIGLAETGSGKTAAFALPLAQTLRHGHGVRALILSPTREIALQTKAFLDLFGGSRELQTACIIGGVAMGPQVRDLKQHPDILVATPGRLLDHERRGNVSLAKIRQLVLDEADHMLDLGFLPQIRQVLQLLTGDRQTMMFSATMPEPIERLTRRFMRDPVRVDEMPDGRAARGIKHRLYLVDERSKKPCVLSLLQHELGSTLVFTRRKVDAEWLCRVLEKDGHPVARIHSDRSQRHRVEALESFREGQHRILVATDIAARGIDIPGIDHIINFEMPGTVEDYIHRAGRTARGAAQGIVSSIGTWRDKPLIRNIESELGHPLPRCTTPGVEPYEERKTRLPPARRSPLRR